MAAADYSFRRVSVVRSNGNPPFQLLPSNPNRVLLVIGSFVAVGAGLVTVSTDASGLIAWTTLTIGDTRTHPYRDYGPLIKEEVYVSVNVNNTTIFATEVFRLSN